MAPGRVRLQGFFNTERGCVIQTDPYVHLHVHSHYSLLDGACKIGELIDSAKQNHMDALALTDHGNLYGAIDFVKTAQSAGIKPIIGCEAYLAIGSIDSREGRGGHYFHITLLVENEAGYRNLIKLCTDAYLKGFYYKPRIDRKMLMDHREGLIALSGCMKGASNQSLLKDDYDQALAEARALRDLFGEKNFFMELMDNGVDKQRELNSGLIQIAEKLSIPPVATNDVHYVTQDDSFAHDCLICIGHGKTVDDPNRLRYPTDQFYFKNGDQMRTLFEHIPEAIDNTRAIADRCNMEIDFGTRHMPKFESSAHQSNQEVFEELCESGAKKIYGDPMPTEARERLEHEKGVITRMGYVSYFLIVYDFVNFAREEGIPVGYRGSCGGSLVAYALGITTIDPLRYNILFERFLDEERVEAPDIDIDLCIHGRERVIQYVIDKYGADKLAQIITFGTLGAKAAIRDVGRVLDIPLSEVDKVAKLIPTGPGVKLKAAIEQSAELTAKHKSDPLTQRWFDTALRVEGTCRNAGTHAAGVVIADRPLDEYIPLCKNGDDVTTQFDMNSVESVGLVKFDFLGLRTLTVIDTAVKIIEQTHGFKVDVDNLPLDDAKTFDLFCRADTKGVFQFESSGFRDLLKKLKPDRVEHLIVANALYRPAAIQAGVIDDFVEARHGRKQVTYKHPILREVLEETYGVMAYQGQVMLIVHKLANISLANSLTLIKAISKKKRRVIAEMKDQFIDGAIANGASPSLAREIFDLVEYFGGYGFNKSHAAAYAMVAYKTAYLKAHYPVAFMAALLTSEVHDTDKVLEYMDDSKRLGLEVLPPSVSASHPHFSVEDGKIRFGLSAVKGLGGKVAEAIVVEREANGSFTDLFDFCERVDSKSWNRSALESMIKCGAFDSTGGHRAQQFSALDSAMEHGTQMQRDKKAGQKLLFGGPSTDSRGGGFSAAGSTLPETTEWTKSELAQYEMESFGFYLAHHPLNEQRAVIRRYSSATIRDLTKLKENDPVRIGCMITECRKRPTKKGDMMAWLTVQALDGQVDVVVFPRTFQKCEGLLQKDRIILLTGKVDTTREEPSIRADNMIAIEDTHRMKPKTVTVRLKSNRIDSQTLDQLREVFAAHPGRCAGYLAIESENDKCYTVRVGETLNVKPSDEFVTAIDSLVGEECIVFA